MSEYNTDSQIKKQRDNKRKKKEEKRARNTQKLAKIVQDPDEDEDDGKVGIAVPMG